MDYLRTNFLRTDFLQTDHPSRRNRQLKPIASIGWIIFGRIIFGRTFLGRIILRSETPKIGMPHEWSRNARVTRSRSPTLVRHVIKIDGRKRRKKSLYAQNLYVYVRTKSLYAQKPYVYVRTKSLYAQKPYNHVRINPYIVRTSRSSYAQVALSA